MAKQKSTANPVENITQASPVEQQENAPGEELQHQSNAGTESGESQQSNAGDISDQQTPPAALELRSVTRYQVNRDLLEHDGVRYGIGDPIEISDQAQLNQLLKVGAVVSSNVALLVGGVNADGSLVELADMELETLQKLGADLGINQAEKLNKEALIEAITALELEVIEQK